MPYTPGGPYTVGGNFTAANANNIETGVSGAYTELESITGADGTALPSTNGPFTLANFINYLVTQIKAITGGAHWYTAPLITLSALAAHKSRHATGGADALAPSDIGAAVSPGGNTFTSIQEVSRTLSGSIKEFFRMTATDGNQYSFVENADGSLSIRDNTHSVNLVTFQPTTGAITRLSNTVWDSGNDGSGSGLDADTVDGVQASGFVQFGSGGQKTGFKDTMGNALPVSGMVKGDRHTLTPFVLP